MTDYGLRVTSHLQKQSKVDSEPNQERTNRGKEKKNREYPAEAGSGSTDQCDCRAKRNLGYVEVCADSRRLAIAIGHRRSDQEDCR